jgi:hypothetical protein
MKRRLHFSSFKDISTASSDFLGRKTPCHHLAYSATSKANTKFSILASLTPRG